MKTLYNYREHPLHLFLAEKPGPGAQKALVKEFPMGSLKVPSVAQVDETTYRKMLNDEVASKWLKPDELGRPILSEDGTINGAVPACAIPAEAAPVAAEFVGGDTTTTKAKK